MTRTSLEIRQEQAGEALSALIPAYYRRLDAAHPAAIGDAGPLRALVDLLAGQSGIVEEDIARLYDEWFIETCSDWVVPYIGALIRARMLPSATADGQRRFVANTIAYRSRKGTVGVIEQLARDVAGWPALAAESFRGLALNQSLLHVRRGQGAFADLRNPARASAAGGPFDAFAHRVDVRRPGLRGARWSIPAIALFLWRQQAALLQRVEAAPEPAAPWLFHADPEGRARPWLNWARTDSDVDQRAREAELPVLLRRRVLADELRGHRLVADPLDYLRPEQPAFRIDVQDVAGGAWRQIEPARIRVVNLAGASAALVRPDDAMPARDGGALVPKTELLVDPGLGRIAVPTGVPVPAAVRTDHLLGFGAEIGAGPFDRNAELRAMIETIGGGAPVSWQAGVKKDRLDVPAENLFGTVAAAVAAWNALPAGPRVGLILIEDSARHDLGGGTLAVTLKNGSGLIVAAARWPFDGAEPLADRIGRFEASALRPHIAGKLSVKATGAARLGLSGLLHSGGFHILAGKLTRFVAAHCSFDADAPLTAGPNPELAMTLDHCLCGPLALDARIPELALDSTIVQAGASGVAIAAEGARTTIQSSSLFGRVDPIREIWASSSLFTDVVMARRTQAGCVRFCYVPPGSRVPRRYRCQPEHAVKGGAEPKRVRPHLVSLDRASPWHGQFHPLAHPALRTGGEDGGEIGAFRSPSSALNEANVDATLDEYLRLGMAAGTLIAT
ncbi:MAG TPA: hypothetical protein VF552_14740 [Allosphingosinicella sp.]|jgi:hypothetical protein